MTTTPNAPTKSTAPVKVQITGSALKRLLGSVLPFADKGDTLPVLSAVHIRGHGTHITAAATDRYRLGVQRAAVPAPTRLDVVLPIASAKRMLAMFKATRDLDPELQLTFTRDRVTVESGALDLDLFSARIAFGLYQGDYPNVDKIITEAVTAEAVPLPPGFAISPALMADFRLVQRDSATPMRLHVGKPGRQGGQAGPLVVAIGDDFRGALMPVRFCADPDGEVEPLLDDTWTALLSGKELKPPRARRGRKQERVPA